MILSMAACGNADGTPAQTTAAPQSNTPTPTDDNGFRVGFSRIDITPKESLPLGSYGNSSERMSTGYFTYLYISAMAISYGDDTLMMLTLDHSWFYSVLGEPTRLKINKEYGIPMDHIILNGTHTHQAPDSYNSEIPAQGRYNNLVVDSAPKACGEALDDRAPADIYIGSVKTEHMNFIRRYFMDDGSLIADNTEGTGTKVVAHETEVDAEMQLMRFVRADKKDILVANFQAHPHLEPLTTNLSAQTVGAFRTSVEKKMDDVWCLYWQGAAGNINTHSRLEGDMLTEDRDKYGDMLADYAVKAADSLQKVESGPIQVKIYDFNGSKNICGHQVKEARKRAGLSQEMLAARLQTEGVNIERDSVSRIEIGTRFVADYELAAICRVLNVTPEYLLGI
jgi:DNA-binding XRE family transcriptional regulator